PAAIGTEAADETTTGKGKVTNGIQHLMAHELVRIAQSFRIDHALVLADHDGVFERGAESEARSPQPLDILDEAEGAGAGNIANERLAVHIHRQGLTADRRCGKIDLDLEAGAAMGPELRPGVARFDPDLL